MSEQIVIPRDQEKRKKIFALVQECVEYKLEQQRLRSDIANCSDVAKEAYDMTKSDFNKLVNAAYDIGKIEDKVEGLSTIIATLEILAGKREMPEEETEESQEEEESETSEEE